MKKGLLLIVLTLAGTFLFAQNGPGSVKGTLKDSTGGDGLSDATVSLMNTSDSSLVSFTLTSNSGYFEIKNIPADRYRLLLSHVNYYNVARHFIIDDSLKFIELGKIPMTDKTKVLSEVIVKSEAPPVTLLGDTVQYNAGSFKTQPNASVEELLKKLPGVQVDNNGTVKAQGETVKKNTRRRERVFW